LTLRGFSLKYSHKRKYPGVEGKTSNIEKIKSILVTEKPNCISQTIILPFLEQFTSQELLNR
jgi:hypothetical protein